MTNDVEEICKGLQSNERRPKVAALEQLQNLIDSQTTKATDVHAIFDECYLHLLKCYTDRYESVRNQAAETVTLFIERLPPNDFHLLNVIATLAERMGQHEMVEESEEIRLVFVRQLYTVLHHYVSTGNATCLQECYPEIVRVLKKALRDPYPAVQRETCACITILADSADTYVFQQWAEPLAKSLYGMLNHKHSMSRIAAIAALARVALHIDASGEALSRLLMEVSPLLMDTNPLVRRECGQLGTLLLLELRDRYSYFDRIIPLVLCCLKDDSPEVSENIRLQWVKCGKQYYDENETELSKQELADLLPANYPSGVQRPTVGCRGMVQRSLRLLKLITRESTDWKENVRLHSLKLLYQFVLHAEAAMTAKFFEIYADVARACRDAEPTVVNEALKVADLMGRLLCYDDWREHGFEGLTKNAKEGYLKCFYFMFTAAIGAKMVDVLRVSEILIEAEFSQTLKPDFQLYVLKLGKTLLDKSGHLEQNGENEGTNESLYKNLYIATIKVIALALADATEVNGDKLQALGNEILGEIAERKCTIIAELHTTYFIAALEYVQSLDVSLDAATEPILLLHGLLTICKFRAPYLKELQAKLNEVFEHCADDAKVKMFSAVSIAMLQWHDTIGKELDDSTQLLREFLIAVVEPHLEWKAGANAEAMRSLATATLCSMSQGAPIEARQVLPMFAKYVSSLLEDHSASTRHYAVKCMCNFGSLKIELLRPLAYGTLQRLDDPSAGIRELAAIAVSKLTPEFEVESSEEKSCDRQTWEIFIRKALDMMFLHYGGPELRLKQAIKDSILKFAEEYPDICKESFKRTLAVSYNGQSLLELQEELPFSV